MTWQIIAVGAPLLFVTYQSLSKLLPTTVSPFLINMYASLVGVVVMGALYLLTAPTRSFSLPVRSIWIALTIGTLISLGNAAIIRAYGLGAPQSSFASIFFPLMVLYALGFGIIFWREHLNIYQIIGTLLVLVGVILVVYFKQ